MMMVKRRIELEIIDLMLQDYLVHYEEVLPGLTGCYKRSANMHLAFGEH